MSTAVSLYVVGTTPVKIANGGEGLIGTSAAVMLGGPGIKSTDTDKFVLQTADGLQYLPALGHELWAVCASGNANVRVLQ
jgi:hypothetical protein